jgi:hypothetical protein
LAAQGSTLLLLFKMTNTTNLSCLSYNTASFNKLDIAKSDYNGPMNNTTIDQWSPSAFTINKFGSAASIQTPLEPEPVTEHYQIAGNLSCATLDGVIHLMHNNPDNDQLVTETFSLSGILTPKLPVSYDPGKPNTTSNGYGTMAEAGWSEQTAINGVVRQANSPLCATRFKDQLWLFYQPDDQQQIVSCIGEYRQ